MQDAVRSQKVSGEKGQASDSGRRGDLFKWKDESEKWKVGAFLWSPAREAVSWMGVGA